MLTGMHAPPLLICAANFSEGRNLSAVAAISSAGGSRCSVLDVHSDTDHNRSVITFSGVAAELAEGLLAAAAAAVDLIDMRRHDGVHPSLGAVDVVPFVGHGDMPFSTVSEAAKKFARRMASDLAVPCFMYGFADPAGRSLPEVRREATATEPDFGPSRPHPTAGSTAVGAREPLVAYNVNLDTTNLRIAAEIAHELRTLPYVRALGFPLASRGLVQVSCNLLQPQTTSMADVFDAVTRLASRRATEVVESELVGLAPRIAFGGRDLQSLKFTRQPKILEPVLAAMGRK